MKNLFLLLCLFFLSSCAKENFTEKKNSTITLRTDGCVSGQFIVENGMMKFLNFNEFKKSMDFYNCASKTDIESLENSIQIQTTAKIYKNFLNLFCIDDNCEEFTEQQYQNILNQFQGKIKITGDQNNHEFGPKFKIYNEFTNQDGMFMVGNSLIAIQNNKIISILDGDQSKIQIAINLNHNSTEQGIFIHDIVYNMNPPLCTSPCPFTDSKTDFDNDDDPEYRYKVEYGFLDGSFVTPTLSCSSPLQDVHIILEMNIEGSSQKKKWLIGWGCSSKSRSKHIWDGEMQINHTFTNIPNPTVINLDLELDKLCYVKKKFTFSQSFFCIHPLFVPDILVCIESIKLNCVARNDKRTLSVDFNCL